jgi:hypothetical protein
MGGSAMLHLLHDRLPLLLSVGSCVRVKVALWHFTMVMEGKT